MANDVEEGRDYLLSLDPEDKNWASVTLMGGKYDGVSVRFGRLSFGTEKVDGTLDCSFHYELIEGNGHTPEELEEDNNFVNLLGDVAIKVLITELEGKISDDGHSNDNRENDSSQSDI